MMRKIGIVIGILTLGLLSACGGDDITKQEEHDGATCVYESHYNFWGSETSRELIACSEPHEKGK